MDEKSPAFRFYPRDFFMDENVARMSDADVGIYIRLMSFAWLEGSIPSDITEIAELLPRTTRRDLTRAWRLVGRCFSPHPTEASRLIQPRLEVERQKQIENRDRRAEAGKAGADARWHSHGEGMANASESDGIRNADAMAKNGLAFAFALASSEKEDPGAPDRPVARVPAVPDMPHFGDLEPDVLAYLANAAGENKTGKISPGREFSLRRDLAKAFLEIDDPDAFASGLRAANGAGAPNVNYVRKAARGALERGGLAIVAREPERVLPSTAALRAEGALPPTPEAR